MRQLEETILQLKTEAKRAEERRQQESQRALEAKRQEQQRLQAAQAAEHQAQLLAKDQHIEKLQLQLSLADRRHQTLLDALDKYGFDPVTLRPLTVSGAGAGAGENDHPQHHLVAAAAAAVALQPEFDSRVSQLRLLVASKRDSLHAGLEKMSVITDSLDRLESELTF